MRLLKKLFGRISSSRGVVSLSFLQQGIAIAIAKYSDENKLRFIHCEWILPDKNLEKLEQLAIKYELNEFDCYLLLTSEDYRLLNIEMPTVEENEMTEAVRWKINDLIDFPSDQAEIDFFRLPPAKHQKSSDRVSVIASPVEQITQQLQQCTHSELNIKIIDIQETALRNLAMLLPENERGIAILHMQQHSGMIIIQKSGTLYLSRKLETGFQDLDLDVLEAQDTSLQQSNFVLEIQRSLDYVESYYGLPSISGIAVIPMQTNTQNFIDFLNGNHGLTARVLDMSTIMDLDFLLDDLTQSYCSPVIGAALRHSVAPL